jgi:hypothetical protein
LPLLLVLLLYRRRWLGRRQYICRKIQVVVLRRRLLQLRLVRFLPRPPTAVVVAAAAADSRAAPEPAAASTSTVAAAAGAALAAAPACGCAERLLPRDPPLVKRPLLPVLLLPIRQHPRPPLLAARPL